MSTLLFLDGLLPQLYDLCSHLERSKKTVGIAHLKLCRANIRSPMTLRHSVILSRRPAAWSAHNASNCSRPVSIPCQIFCEYSNSTVPSDHDYLRRPPRSRSMPETLSSNARFFFSSSRISSSSRLRSSSVTCNSSGPSASSTFSSMYSSSSPSS